MKVTVLYLDKLNLEMEKMFINCFDDNIDVKFLEPTLGKKGLLNEADIIVDTTFKVTKDIIDSAPNLKLIQRTGIGVDMVDVDYARQKGIPISVCKGFNTNSVAELTILYILALYRRLVSLDAYTKKGEWHTWTYRHKSYEIKNKTVGILGIGKIGRNVIRKIKAFGAKVIYYDPHRLTRKQEDELGVEYSDFYSVLSDCDILSLHLPLTPSTKFIIGAKEFSYMKKSAILINTARDLLVDMDALIVALNNNYISGAAIDIFKSLDNITLLNELENDNLILTPHIGAATFDNYSKVYDLCSVNALHISNGEPPEMLLS